MALSAASCRCAFAGVSIAAERLQYIHSARQALSWRRLRIGAVLVVVSSEQGIVARLRRKVGSRLSDRGRHRMKPQTREAWQGLGSDRRAARRPKGRPLTGWPISQMAEAATLSQGRAQRPEWQPILNDLADYSDPTTDVVRASRSKACLARMTSL